MLGLRSVTRFLVVVVMAALFLGYFSVSDSVQSADLDSVQVIMTQPRYSFMGSLDGAHSAGDTKIDIDASSGKPSISAINLFEGDTVAIGDNTSETVLSADSDDTYFVLSNGLNAGASDGDNIIATRSGTLKVRFTTKSNVTDGRFRVLVPASTGGDGADGLPDNDGFDGTDDFATNVTLTCPDPDDSTGYTTFSDSKNAEQTVGSGVYHEFICDYTGAGGALAFDGSDGDSDTHTREIKIAGLINPAPDDTTAGNADRYDIPVKHETGAGTLVDGTTAAVAVIESVRITAEVAPQLTFAITGVSSGTNVCDIASTSVTTTATEVELGSLLTSSFRSAAQLLEVSTNATGGYSVTAIADDQLRRPSTTCLLDGDADSDGTGDTGCIPDAVGDGDAMTASNSEDWASTSKKGLGYTLQAGSGSNAPASIAFEYNNGGGSCASDTNCYRQFADLQVSEDPVELFSSTAAAEAEQAYVCYKAIVSSQQEAASDYTTQVTYRATPTF